MLSCQPQASQSTISVISPIQGPHACRHLQPPGDTFPSRHSSDAQHYTRYLKQPSPTSSNPRSIIPGVEKSMASSVSRPPRIPNSRAVKWFDETTTVPAPFRELMEKYSHIAPEEVEQHVIELRNRAWEIHPFPCLGQFRFLELNLSERGDLYNRLRSVLADGGLFLDVGCCLGQDLRKLIYDGAPASRVLGAELNAQFIELGYELFRDRGNGETDIVTANIIEPLESSNLAPIVGKLAVIQLGMILHLFTWEEQVHVFENAIRLLKDESGTLIIGQATGNLDGVATGGAVGGRKTFRHNVESFEKLLNEVGEKTGTSWKVKAELDIGLSIYDGKRTWDDPKTRRLVFEVERA